MADGLENSPAVAPNDGRISNEERILNDNTTVNENDASNDDGASSIPINSNGNGDPGDESTSRAAWNRKALLCLGERPPIMSSAG